MKNSPDKVAILKEKNQFYLTSRITRKIMISEMTDQKRRCGKSGFHLVNTIKKYEIVDDNEGDTCSCKNRSLHF